MSFLPRGACPNKPARYTPTLGAWGKTTEKQGFLSTCFEHLSLLTCSDEAIDLPAPPLVWASAFAVLRLRAG